MSDSEPDASPRFTWEKAHEQTVELVDKLTQQLGEYHADEHLERSVRMLALLVHRSILSQQMTLMHVGSLERRLTETKALLRHFVKASVELADAEDETREHLEQRLEQIEYATVAETELERLKEQLAGDLADMMAGRLRGEDGS